MKTIIKTIIILSLIWTLLVGHVTADLNVTPSKIGTTFITWDWDDGSNVSEIRVDGLLMCGYETTLPSINVLGMTPNTCHNISVASDFGNGTNESCTLYEASRGGGGGTSTGNDSMLSTTNIIYGLLGALVAGVIVVGKFIVK